MYRDKFVEVIYILYIRIYCGQVLLRDPMDENIVPVVEELKRRLGRMSGIHQHNRDGKSYLENQREAEGSEYGMLNYR